MSEGKYLDLGLAAWNTGFHIAAVQNPNFDVVNERMVMASSPVTTISCPPWTISFLELIHHLVVKKCRAHPYTWAILHWHGNLADVTGEVTEAFYFANLELTQNEANQFFQAAINTWKREGWMFPKLAAMAKAREAALKIKCAAGGGIARDAFKAKSLDEARLKVLSADYPMTVSAMKDNRSQAINAWQLEGSRGIGSKIDPVNYELALNWPEYKNLMAKELADKIMQRTGVPVKPRTLEKRRESLGLFTERPPGPREKATE